MANIKAMVWDVDGVLLTDMDGTGSLKEFLGFAPEVGVLTGHIDFEPCLVGTLDTKQAILDYLNKSGSNLEVDAVMAAWLDSEHQIDHKALKLINDLEHIPHFLGTNQCPYRAEYIWQDLGFNNHFSEMMASGLLGHRKPERDFFAQAHDKISGQLGAISPDEVLFMDDVQENVNAAQQFGWRAECYNFKQVEQLPDILMQHGVSNG